MSAKNIVDKYIEFFEDKGHKRIQNSPLVPQDDPTTLFTSSGMQPLISYLLGEPHPAGKRLVNIQNCFRAVDIDEVGDNRHTTFFRMLGNWSLGDYFKKEQLPWFWEFLTEGLGLDPKKLYVTVFEGNDEIEKDEESINIWNEIHTKSNINPAEHILSYDVDKNWWSRSGPPDKMPPGEPGGPDSEVFYDFGTPHDKSFGETCHPNCQCGRFMEIGNSVFMQYIKQEDGSFKELPNRNVDFGAGLERLLAAKENQNDIFKTSLFSPIISSIEKATDYPYEGHEKIMRTTADHFIAATFLISAGVKPSKTEQGYILRRLIRRGLDSFRLSHGADISTVVEKIVEVYASIDPLLKNEFEEIKNTILEEEQGYDRTIKEAEKIISASPSPSPSEDEDHKEISAEEAFRMYSTHGLSPTQIKSLGYVFDEQKFADLMEEHQKKSKTAGAGMFRGGLADHSELTIKGHTATHLLHQALRDVFGSGLHQTGSNITSERVRFDFNLDKALTPEEIQKVEEIVKNKIKENLPVHFEMMPLAKAKEIGAIGLFDEKYQESVKVYFVGDYSKEFCGGPHVDFTSEIKSFKIIKQDNLGRGQRRIYAKVE